MSAIIEKLRDTTVERLTQMLDDTLATAEKGVVDQIGGFLSLSNNREEIVSAFRHGMYNHFEELLDRPIEKPQPEYNFETLSLVQDDDLEIMVALEGMINASRNSQLPTFISFNTRLNSLFEKKRIDESTNPLDPSQVAAAFKDAIQPLAMDAQNTLSIYRAFNSGILQHLGEVMSEANRLLVDIGVMPNMKVDSGKGQSQTARSSGRPQSRDEITSFGTVEEDPYDQKDENPELFSMMQNLLHPGQIEAPGSPSGEAPLPSEAGPGSTAEYAIPASLAGEQSLMQPFTPAAGEQVQMVDQAQLMDILSNIQKALEARPARDPDSDAPDAVDKVDITSQLGEFLKENTEDGKVSAVDRQSSDIINLVTMLYEAIWQDDSVPIPIKELIGRTQVTIIKVALSDTSFFNRESHPARVILNEFAEAGIGWTEVDNLAEDPLYQKIQELVNRILTDYDGDTAFFEQIIKDFRTFRAREAAKTRSLEQRILRAGERQERLDDIHELVTQKINERVLGRELPEFVEELLDGPFHKFMVKLVLKEGPGTNAWKQAINTIDVLLWTVQPHDHDADRDRLDTVNPRLLNNLRKAFRIAQLTQEEVEQLVTRLQEVQQDSFVEMDTVADDEEEELRFDDDHGLDEEDEDEEEDATGLDLDREQSAAERRLTKGESSPPVTEPAPKRQVREDKEEELADDDPSVQQVEQLSVGVWVEFVGEEPEPSIRCKLAAKIKAIDKFIFVNRQGVKVVEKTRLGLARELKDGTVRFISDGPLFSRALESVIGNLRESQQEQQSGGAYQPDRASG